MRTLLSVPALAAALSLCLAESVSATSTVTMLDTTADVGRYASLAMGADGLGLIAYYDITNRDLKVAHCENVPCTSATISTLDAGDVDFVGGLAIGGDGRGIIAYYDSAQAAIKTAHCNDLACTSATLRTIVAPVSAFAKIARGSDGLPLLAYVAGFRVRTVHCTVADCASTTVGDVGPAPGVSVTALGIGADGLGLIGVGRPENGPVDIRRCLDVACSAATPGLASTPGPLTFVEAQAIVTPADGRPLLGFHTAGPGPGDVYARFSRCGDAGCAVQAPIFSIITTEVAAVALQPNGLGWLAYGDNQRRIALGACTDSACANPTVSCVNADPVFFISLARGSDGRSLVAFHRFLGGLGVAYDVSDACADPQLSVADVAAPDLPAGQASFAVTLNAPSARAITVDYATANGTATAGQDYVAASGTLTFAPGALTAQIPVTILADGLDEPDESFSLTLSNAVAAGIADGDAVGTIVDGDPTPLLKVSDCAILEGAGVVDCQFTVELLAATSQTVTVDYATADVTANAGIDYFATSGTLTFTSSPSTQSVFVTIDGDALNELDETYHVILSNPVNAAFQDAIGEGAILNDDGPLLTGMELTHGALVLADLAAAGPVANQDFYRVPQGPYTSWEVTADAVSGDVAPGLVMERLATDNVTVLQTGAAVGMGSAQALRWERRSALADTRPFVRVRSTGCTTACGPDDVYRLRAYETTATIPRFNNSATQGTVVILQNTTDEPVAATLDFWRSDGALLATTPLGLAPHAVGIVNAASIAALAGGSGSVTITHDGPYAALAGKAVALEPATGFAFDTPLTYKPR